MGARTIALGFLAAAALSGIVLVTGGAAATQSWADWAKPVGALPAQVGGSTTSGHVQAEAPVPSCSVGQRVVWYTVTAPSRGPMLATVVAGDDSDAALVVYRLVRSKAREIGCKLTDRSGRASVPWYAYPERSYLIGVARRAGAPAGPFRLSVASREPLPQAPGTTLPSSGGVDTVTPFLDAADAWAVPMQRGTSYKINLASPRGCVRLDIYRPGTYRFGESSHADRGKLACGGYLLFTPGIDGGGTYSLLVSADGSKPVPQPYKLMVTTAGLDDSAPGVALESGVPVPGSLDSATLDVSDLYTFTVPRNGSLTTIGLTAGPTLRYDLLVLDESGGRIAGVTRAHGKQSLQEHIQPGRYFLVLRALHQTGGAYRLTVLTRVITATSLYANGARYAETRPGSSVSFGVSVTSASHGGVVEIEVDRFDPVFGWQFARVIPGAADFGGRLTVGWTPPWAGHWRALARFVGNEYSTPSESGYVFVHVAAPLET